MPSRLRSSAPVRFGVAPPTWSVLRHAVLCLLVGCGAPSPELTPEPVPSVPAPAVAPAPAPEAPPVSVTPATVGVTSCEGLARPCGGWEGCVLVRHVSDEGGVAHYEGLGEHAGHDYSESTFCVDGVCNEMCDPVSGVCRPGLIEDLPIACSRATPPSRAPFFCQLVEGACMRREVLAPPSGGYS